MKTLFFSLPLEITLFTHFPHINMLSCRSFFSVLYFFCVHVCSNIVSHFGRIFLVKWCLAFPQSICACMIIFTSVHLFCIWPLKNGRTNYLWKCWFERACNRNFSLFSSLLIFCFWQFLRALNRFGWRCVQSTSKSERFFPFSRYDPPFFYVYNRIKCSLYFIRYFYDARTLSIYQ